MSMQGEGNTVSQRTANRRIAATLLSIAVVFFGGIILAQASGAPAVAIGVLGFAILGFVAVAMGRNVGGRGRK